MPEGIGEFQSRRSLAKPAAGEGAGKGAAAAAGDRSRRLQPELCKFLACIPVWAGRSGKTLFFFFLPEVETAGLDFFLTMPL